jgi:uncharacterized coiled-coil DUF342 family protein
MRFSAKLNENIQRIEKILRYLLMKDQGQSDFRQMQGILQSLDHTIETLTAETVREKAVINQLQQGYGGAFALLSTT